MVLPARNLVPLFVPVFLASFPPAASGATSAFVQGGALRWPPRGGASVARNKKCSPILQKACRAPGASGLAQARMSTSSLRGGAAPEELRDSVLRFWFGEDFWKDGFGAMEQEEYFTKSVFSNRWYLGGAALDKEIADTFTDLIRAAGKGELEGGLWDEPTGMLVKIILCDQLSRNAFRGTKEAFAYDGKAVELARRAVAMEEVEKGLPSAAIQFFVMPLMHSEDLADHLLIEMKLKEACAKLPEGHKLNGTLQYELQHRAVIERFGRYPHRNKHFGRETTPQEAEWLASPDCPGWAKSQ